MEEQIAIIKRWLGAGSVNILGLPFSGKDTLGARLAEMLGGKFLSSGDVIRRHTSAQDLAQNENKGFMAPTDRFREVILPLLFGEAEPGKPLILGSVGRWIGEERVTVEMAQRYGHPLRAVILLNVSESEAKNRWETARALPGQENMRVFRGERADDKTTEVLQTRFNEFVDKTLPVVWAYHNMGMILHVNGTQSREAVAAEAIEKLAGAARAYFAAEEARMKAQNPSAESESPAADLGGY